MARTMLRALGWRIEGTMPEAHKFVLVCAPHTSRWDLWLTVLTATSAGVRVHWLGKHTLFWIPNGWLLKLLGGVPIDRDGGKDTVAQIARVFAERERLALAISPEGAKRWRSHWRSGFWYVARTAEVPLVVASLDWSTRVVRIGPVLQPTTLSADMEIIREALAHVVPRHPERFGPVRLLSEGEQDG